MGLKIINGKISFPSLKREISLSNPKIQKAKLPQVCVLPMSQHPAGAVRPGRPAVPVVKPGDRVLTGTLIGAADGKDSTAVHASVSGTVKNIGLYPHPFLGSALAVEIESDGKDTLDPGIRRRNTDAMSGEEILNCVREAGIAELNGAGGPKMQTVIIDGTECEPYLVGDYLVMMEKTLELVEGAKIVKRVTGAGRVYLAAGENSLEAIETVNSKLFSLGLNENLIESVTLPAHYPQGESRRLIKDVLGVEIPRGKTAADLGILVLDVNTVVAVCEAVKLGKPLYERVVTVSGECLAQTKNLMVRFGTPLHEVIRQCSGFLRKPGRLVMGGLMRGIHQEDMNAPVVKATTALIALPPEETKHAETQACIRCGYCIEACPEKLVPSILTLAVEAGREELLKEFGAENCTLCGNCSYVCPSKRPMTELLTTAARPAYSPPFIRADVSALGMTWRKFLLLLPVAFISIQVFGVKALSVLALSLFSAALTETLLCLALKKKIRLQDGSALLTGLLTAFLIPAGSPWWVAALGGSFAVLAGRELFGGTGQYVFQPALLAKIFLIAFWPEQAGGWLLPMQIRWAALLLNGAMIAAGFLLMQRRVIPVRLPYYYMAGYLAVSLALGRDALGDMLTGPALMLAFFYLPDFPCVPGAQRARVSFSLCAALLGAVLRFVCGLEGGEIYGILFMNALTPAFDRYARPRFLGETPKFFPDTGRVPT